MHLSASLGPNPPHLLNSPHPPNSGDPHDSPHPRHWAWRLCEDLRWDGIEGRNPHIAHRDIQIASFIFCNCQRGGAMVPRKLAPTREQRIWEICSSRGYQKGRGIRQPWPDLQPSLAGEAHDVTREPVARPTRVISPDVI
jgi:hypothetical protein